MSKTLAFVDFTPLSTIDGQAYGVWHYQLSWDAAPEHPTHVVTTGESLSAIAARFLGEARRWPEIFRLNRAAIANPNLIFPGQVLELPAGVGFETQVGIGFSAHIDIRNPSTFPDAANLRSMRLQKMSGADVQFVATELNQSHGTTLEFFLVAPSAVNPSTEVILATKADDAAGWHDLAFDTTVPGQVAGTPHTLRGPAVIASTGGTKDGTGTTTSSQPPSFVGILPYASEIFGVYQPLAGWLGRLTTDRVSTFFRHAKGNGGGNGPALNLTKALDVSQLSRAANLRPFSDESQAVLSPVGLVTLFREYFFEFDNFLGAPSGHLWISPGGTVEVIESSTRRTLTEKTAEQSEDTTSKVEESLTSQDDVADAVKEDNANDTKLGASASAGAKFAGMYHADASASFSNQTTTHKSSEVTHKHTRTQSAKVSSEIHRNFKTTFKTVTESTDVTSRRYVVQNTTNQLVNYELRRKMRKVGIQVQHIGTRLSWQVFLDIPGKDLGLGELVHVVPAPDLSSLKKPEPPPPLQKKDTEFSGPFTLQRFPGTENDPHQDANYTRSEEHPLGITGMHSDNNDDHIVGDADYHAQPPGSGYTLDSIRPISAKTQAGDAQFLAEYDRFVASTGAFRLKAKFLNFGGGRIINFTLGVTWNPPAIDPAQAAYDKDLAVYNAAVADIQRKAFGEAMRDRVRLVSEIRRRPSEDLRKEERQSVYGKLIRDLQLFQEPHVGSELIRQIFDVDEMLYFTAPDYWRPTTGVVAERTDKSVGKYPVPQIPAPTVPASSDSLDGETVAGWYSHTDKNNTVDPMGEAKAEWRIDYLITEASQPAPFGSSLGWLIQVDGDERRNEFLNAAWVKAVLPIRPGHEVEALAWLALANVEGEAGLGQPYPMQPGDPDSYKNKTLSEVLGLLAAELQASNTDMKNTLATEKVFETGFDPLGTGFRPAEPYMIFDEWVEVLPTDQVVALEVRYDPKTGKLA